MRKDKNYIYSLMKGLAIIRMFSSRSSISLSEVASAQGMSVGSAHRYLSTLHFLGYIKQNVENKRYQLTLKILELGFYALKDMGLRKRVLPHLLEISRKFNITTACSILDGVDILYVERVRSAQLVNLDLSVGSRLPIYCTGMGKALLAFLPSGLQEALIEKLELRPLTPHTIIKKETLRKELAMIKERGYATCRQELSLGVESIAAPIYNDQQMEAAISFNLPHAATGKKHAMEKILVAHLLKTAKDVST